MDITILVATHKKYWMPTDDMYLPVFVGAADKDDIGYQRDDEGENISKKNSCYCELTGLYWAWKNIKSTYIGLVHYRRYFSNRGIIAKKREKIATRKDIESKIIESETDIILPNPRNYWIETNYSQYAHAHHAIDLDKTKEILREYYPEYLQAFDKSMSRTKGHRFNMFIMKRDLMDKYCTWLFSVLFELEKHLDISNYNDNDKRVFGFVSERLLDVWIETNDYRYIEMPYVFIESQNWLIKGGRFLKRKIKGNNHE